MSGGRRLALISGALAIIVALIAWPILPGYASFTYRSNAAFIPSGQIILVMDGPYNRATRVQVDYDTSPDIAMDHKTQLDIKVETSWDDTLFISIVFTGALATGFSECISGGHVIYGKKETRDELSDFEREAIISSLANAEVNGGYPSSDEDDAQTGWRLADETPMVKVQPTGEDPWSSRTWDFERSDGSESASFEVYVLSMKCSFEAPAIWQASDTERVLNLPTVAAFTNTGDDVPRNYDNRVAETLLVVSRTARIKSHPDWTLSSTTSSSTLGKDGVRTYSNSWNSVDASEARLAATGFATLYSDRRAENQQQSLVFFAGIAAGAAAMLLISVLKLTVDSAMGILSRSRVNRGA